MAKRGRKTVLTDEVHERIVTLTRAGAYFEHACAAAGVSDDAARGWKKRGLENPDEEPYASFALELQQAQAEYAVQNQVVISSAAKGRTKRVITDQQGKKHTIPGREPDWKAAAWDLQRRFPHIYGDAALQEEIRTILAIVRSVVTPEHYAKIMQLIVQSKT